MVAAMRAWLRLHSAGFVARSASSSKLGGRPRELLPAASDGKDITWLKQEGANVTSGDKSAWLFINNDRADLAAPHNKSLVTRFSDDDTQFAARTGHMAAMTSALSQEGYDVPKSKSRVVAHGIKVFASGIVLGIRLAPPTRERSAHAAAPAAREPTPQSFKVPLLGRKVSKMCSVAT